MTLDLARRHILDRPAACADVPARAAESRKLVKLPELCDRRSDRLSGGQQQRVPLARTTRPRLPLLDELMSAPAKMRRERRTELKRMLAISNQEKPR
jgi:ABC-type Fe3+/spermidine/putrescine transport system ATPase subunit